MDEREKRKAQVALMDRISEGSESDKSKSGEKARSIKSKLNMSSISKSVSRGEDVSDRTSSSSIAEAVEDASQLDSIITENTASDALRFQTGSKARKISDSAKDDDASYSMDFSENTTATLGQSHTRVSMRGKSELDISEHIEEASVGSIRSASASHSHPKLNFASKSNEKKSDNDAAAAGPLSPPTPTIGIQESDSETESRLNSYHTSVKSEGSSRPSSERSVGSISYSAEDDDEEEDIISYGSDKTPVKGSPTKLLPSVGVSMASASAKANTEDDISEHISGSLPSISERRTHSGGSLRQDSQEMINDLLGYKEEEDEDKTPVPTPREMGMEKEKNEGEEEEEEEEENASLLMTDPLADFHLGDHVLVWGRKVGTLKFKGKVDFSPGIWAGVEFDENEGDSDGTHEGKSYFSCPPGHGVLVQGSDISSVEEGQTINKSQKEKVVNSSMPATKAHETSILDESLTTDQDDSNVGENAGTGAFLEGDERTSFLNVTVNDTSLIHSTPISSPHAKQTASHAASQPTPKTHNETIADSITDHLAASILEDTVDTMGKIASKRTPPMTLPKPTKKPSTTINKEDEGADESVDVQSTSAADKTTDGVMDSLLNEAISHMISIKRRQVGMLNAKAGKGSEDKTLVNGDIGEDADLISSKRGAHTLNGRDIEDLQGEANDKENQSAAAGDSGKSVDPFHRPGSPIPGDGHTAEDVSLIFNIDFYSWFIISS